MSELIHALRAWLGHISLTGSGPNPTTGDVDLDSHSPFGEENDRRYRPRRGPESTLQFKLKPVVGIDETVRELTGPVTVLVDVDVN